MRIRLSLTLDITRPSRTEPEQEPGQEQKQHESMDLDTRVELTEPRHIGFMPEGE